MTQIPQIENQLQSEKSVQSVDKPISQLELKAIHAQWRKIDAGRADERDSRTARIEFIERVVMRPISSAKDLSSDEALRVISAMRQETGEEFKPVGYGKRRRQKSGARSQKVSAEELTRIGAMAVELFGERWQDLLNSRLRERFQLSTLDSLTGSQGRQLVEELLQRISVEVIRTRMRNAGFWSPTISRAEIEAEKAQQRVRFFGKL